MVSAGKTCSSCSAPSILFSLGGKKGSISLWRFTKSFQGTDRNLFSSSFSVLLSLSEGSRIQEELQHDSPIPAVSPQLVPWNARTEGQHHLYKRSHVTKQLHRCEGLAYQHGKQALQAPQLGDQKAFSTTLLAVQARERTALCLPAGLLPAVLSCSLCSAVTCGS